MNPELCVHGGRLAAPVVQRALGLCQWSPQTGSQSCDLSVRERLFLMGRWSLRGHDEKI